MQAVILITSHNDEGTAGVILNKPLEHLIGLASNNFHLNLETHCDSPDHHRSPIFQKDCQDDCYSPYLKLKTSIHWLSMESRKNIWDLQVN